MPVRHNFMQFIRKFHESTPENGVCIFVFLGKAETTFYQPFSNTFLFVSCKELDVTLTGEGNIAYR